MKTSDIEIMMPTFSDEEENKQPKKCLKDLTVYYMYKNILPVNRIVVIESCLKGKSSRWFQIIKDTTLTDEAFKTLFLKYFFPEDKQ